MIIALVVLFIYVIVMSIQSAIAAKDKTRAIRSIDVDWEEYLKRHEMKD